MLDGKIKFRQWVLSLEIVLIEIYGLGSNFEEIKGLVDLPDRSVASDFHTPFCLNLMVLVLSNHKGEEVSRHLRRLLKVE